MSKKERSPGSDKLAKMIMKRVSNNIGFGTKLPMKAPRMMKGANARGLPIMTGKSVKFKSVV